MRAYYSALFGSFIDVDSYFENLAMYAKSSKEERLAMEANEFLSDKDFAILAGLDVDGDAVATVTVIDYSIDEDIELLLASIDEEDMF